MCAEQTTVIVQCHSDFSFVCNASLVGSFSLFSVLAFSLTQEQKYDTRNTASTNRVRGPNQPDQSLVRNSCESHSWQPHQPSNVDAVENTPKP